MKKHTYIGIVLPLKRCVRCSHVQTKRTFKTLTTINETEFLNISL